MPCALPIAAPTIRSGSTRGWYGTPLTITRTVTDPDAFHAACTAEGIPLRLPYPDWLTTPLLQRPDLLRDFWPHLRGQYRPPRPDEFVNYQQARRQMLVLKVPDLPAASYMEQVGAALAAVVTRALDNA